MTDIADIQTKFTAYDFKLTDCNRSLQQLNNNLMVAGINLSDPLIQQDGNI